MPKVNYLKIREMEIDCEIIPLPFPDDYEVSEALQGRRAQTCANASAILKQMYTDPVVNQMRQTQVLFKDPGKNLP